MTFTPFAIETLRSLTLNEIFMGRIKLATRSCFWIDPLVKPVRLVALKRIAYDKPIRKQLILSKLVQPNDNHMNVLDRLAGEAKLKDLPIENQEQQLEVKIDSTENQEQQSEVKIDSTEKEEEEVKEEPLPVFKPFLNRMGQLIINPVGRSKEFFNKHNQQLHNDFVKPISSEITQTSSLTNGEEVSNNRSIPLGRGHRINTESLILNRPQSIPVSNAAAFNHSKEHSPFQALSNPLPQSSVDSNVTTPSEVGPNKMTEKETKVTQEEEQEDDEIFEVINRFIGLKCIPNI